MTPTKEDFARYLSWSEEAQEKYKIGSICIEKYQHYFKKSLNTIQFEKMIAYQVIWRNTHQSILRLPNAYDRMKIRLIQRF